MQSSIRFVLLLLCLSAASLHAELVIRVIDGDTLELENGTVIRLLGVDTPETRHPQKGREFFGQEASAYTRSLVLSNQVRIEMDPQAGDTGKYGRQLAYVFLPDNRMLNAILIAEGYGFATPEYRFSQKNAFVELEAEARAQGLGLWAGQGRAELAWLQVQPGSALTLIPMAGERWGVLWAGHARLQLSPEELLKTLEQVRLWARRAGDKELSSRLVQAGWISLE